MPLSSLPSKPLAFTCGDPAGVGPEIIAAWLAAHPDEAAGVTVIGPARWLTTLPVGAAKYRAVEGAWRIVDRAMDVSGGFGMFKKSELERLFRDARAGRFHPANSALSHEIVGKLALGLNPDEMPRWG